MSDDGTSFDYTTLLISEPEAGVVLCTFNRPESRNALGLEMVNEIRALLSKLSERFLIKYSERFLSKLSEPSEHSPSQIN